MNLSPSLRAGLLCFASAQALLLPCLTSAPARAQDKVAAAQVSETRKSQPGIPASFSVNCKATPLRQILTSLFTSANAQYSISEDVPDKPVTLTIRDQPLRNALTWILQEANVGSEKKLTYTVEAEVYRVKIAPPYTPSMQTNSVHLSSVRSSDVMGRLQTAFPTSLILPGGDASSLLVRGSAQQNQDVRELASLLDTAPKTVVLDVEIVMVTEGNRGSAKAGTGKKTIKTSASSEVRTTLLYTSLKGLSGQPTIGEEKLTGTPAQTTKLQINATPILLGDGTFQVDTRWEVSLPLPAATNSANGKGASLVRLEKRLTTTTRLKNRQRAVVGGVILSQYGLKGQILFYIAPFVLGSDVPSKH